MHQKEVEVEQQTKDVIQETKRMMMDKENAALQMEIILGSHESH